MARPTKQGVDYFPLDVHLDDKFKFIEIKYKLEGFAIAVKLLQRVYSQGYWCKWTEDEMLLFSDEIKADYNLLENVVIECLKRDVFDIVLYEKHKILTSKGIQKRYKEIVRRRKDVEWTTEYLLIDDINPVNDDINSIIDDIKPTKSKQDDGKSTQSKLNKTKLNKTKKNDTKKDNKIHYAEFVSMTLEEYEKLISEHGEANVKEMIKVLDNYKGSSGKIYKDDYRAILNWVIERVKGQAYKPGAKKSLFAQGEESRKRQAEAEANYQPRVLTPEEQAEEDELLPF